MYTQGEWIDLLNLSVQGCLLGLRQNTRRQETPQWRLGHIIDATDLIAFGHFRLKLERRLEAVDHQAQRSIDLAQLVVRLNAFQSHTAHRFAYHRTILLLYMRLIIFEPRTPAGKGQLGLLTLGDLSF